MIDVHRTRTLNSRCEFGSDAVMCGSTPAQKISGADVFGVFVDRSDARHSTSN